MSKDNISESVNVIDSSEIIGYINGFLNDDNKDASVHLFMQRISDAIIYGQLYNGIRLKAGIVNIVNEGDLKQIFEMLKEEYSLSFIVGVTHASISGYSIFSQILDKVVLHIDSDNSYDKQWFSEEADKLYRSER